MGKFIKFMNENKSVDVVNESSLSRLHKHMSEHDSGTITAYRSEYNHKENQQRNRSLLAKLTDKRYQVTSVKGSYIENYNSPDAKEVGEHVYFVVDAEDKGRLESDLRALGEEFDQDSIMFVPKGGAKGTLIGTSKRENSWPGIGKKETLPNAVWGKEGQFMTKVRGRPFYFKESVDCQQMVLPEGYFGRWGCHATAVQPWNALEV